MHAKPRTGPDNCNLAACYSCALLPETCCEEGNRLLDRGLIVGNINNRAQGYFSKQILQEDKVRSLENIQGEFTIDRELCTELAAKYLNVSFEKVSTCEYISNDKRYRLVCLFSKQYKTKNYTRYWYSFRSNQKAFLDESKESYVALGFNTPTRIVLIKKEDFYPLLNLMRTTGKGGNLYWHVELFEIINKTFIISPNSEKGRDITQNLVA